jgi:hypothetical protein
MVSARYENSFAYKMLNIETIAYDAAISLCEVDERTGDEC